jgi:hypothetical protein
LCKTYPNGITNTVSQRGEGYVLLCFQKINLYRLYNITNYNDINYDITTGTLGGINRVEMICDVIRGIDTHSDQCKTSFWVCFPDFENNALFKMVNDKNEVMCKQIDAPEEDPFIGTWIIVNGSRAGELLYTNVTDIPRVIKVNFCDLSRYLKYKYRWPYCYSNNVNFTWMWNPDHHTIVRSHEHKPIYKCDVFKKEGGMYCKYDGTTYSLYIGDKKYDKTGGDLTYPVGKYGDLNVKIYENPFGLLSDAEPLNQQRIIEKKSTLDKVSKRQITTEVKNGVTNSETSETDEWCSIM